MHCCRPAILNLVEAEYCRLWSPELVEVWKETEAQWQRIKFKCEQQISNAGTKTFSEIIKKIKVVGRYKEENDNKKQ